MATNLVKSESTEAVNLFRFIHVSDPATKAAGLNATYNFIYNGQAVNSAFLTAIESAGTQEEIDTAIAGVIATFTPIKNSRDVISIKENLYKFGLFVASYKESTSYAAVSTAATGLTALTAEEEELVWDNLYYQALTTASNIVTDSLITLIRANAFFKEFDDIEREADYPKHTDTLSRIASGAVVIPNKLVVREKPTLAQGKNDLEIFTKESLLKMATAASTSLKIETYLSAVREIENAHAIHSKENSDALQIAFEEYREDAEATEPPATIPPFSFTPSDPFLNEFLDEHLSATAKALLQSVRKPFHTNLKQIADELTALVAKMYSTLAKNIESTNGKILFRDITIPVKKEPLNNTYVITSEKIIGSSTLSRIFITHFFRSGETSLTEIELELESSTSETFTSSASTPVYKNQNYETFLLFEQGVPLQLGTGEFTLTGRYGVEHSTYSKEFSVPEFSFKKPYYGYLQFGNEIELDSFNDAEPGNDDIHLYGVKRVGVLEYKRVEQKVCCYVAGEVSHIENIMAREYKEKATRQLTRSEIVQEDTKEKESEKLSDTTSTDRHEMNVEVSQVIQEEKARQIGVNVGASGYYHGGAKGNEYGVDVFANTNMNFTNSSATTNTFNQAESFAKEIVERALQRVVEKVTSKRTSRMLREFEDTYKHGFDNREGDKHVVGIYRWVDKIFENSLVNYGYRMLYDFMVPEPSKNFKYWMTKPQDNTAQTKYIVEPKPLSAFGINNFTEGDTNPLKGWESITDLNYANAAAEYGADVEPCPAARKEIGLSFAENPGKSHTTGILTSSHSFECKIPEGYHCKEFKYYYTHVWHGNEENTIAARISIANHHQYTNEYVPEIDMMDTFIQIGGYIQDDLGVTVDTRDVGSLALNILMPVERTPDAYNAWRQATYIAIVEAYKKRMEEYNNAMAASGAGNEEQAIDYRFNPDMGRAIEQRELKRLCMELMMNPFGIYLGRKNYIKDPIPCFDNYNIDASPDFEKHAAYVKFMEEAFQWELMSYYLYPYYWGDEATWEQLIKETSSSDPLFQAFLQSGMARVTVPVRAGFEYAVRYFLNTGKIWKAKGAATDSNEDLNLTIADLMMPPVGTVEKTWKSRVPTSLTILQDGGGPLAENGLPCYCEDGTPIAQGSNILEGQTNNGSAVISTSTFRFPKSTGLTLADIGKLLVNDGDGTAKVSLLGAPQAEQLGKFRIRISDINLLTDSTELTINIGETTHSFTRLDWRGWGSPPPATPTTSLEELQAIKDYIEGQAHFNNLSLNIVSGELVIEETAFEFTRMGITGNFSGNPLDYVVVERLSQPAAPAVADGFPLGKLITIDGSEAVISNEMVETYKLDAPFTVDNTIFNSSTELTLESLNDFTSIAGHLIVAAADGKVKPLSLDASEFNSEFLFRFRNQIVGLAIRTSGLDVTVVKLNYASFILHLFRRESIKGIFGG